MGSCPSIKASASVYQCEESAGVIKQTFNKSSIPQQLQVAHYTPASFPLVPIIDRRTCKLMADSWAKIVKLKRTDSSGNSTSGITAFYNDFYERIDSLDTSGRFEAVLTQNIEGVSKLHAKGSILIRIIKFIISIEGDSEETQYKLFNLGKSHSHKGIRPWQYSIFVQTLLLSISARLGTDATNEVMEAWVNMLAFVLRSMLPPAIENKVIKTEINVNVSSDFVARTVHDEVQLVQKSLETRRRSSGPNFSSAATVSSAYSSITSIMTRRVSVS